MTAKKRKQQMIEGREQDGPIADADQWGGGVRSGASLGCTPLCWRGTVSARVPPPWRGLTSERARSRAKNHKVLQLTTGFFAGG
eukprot:CAMPEP_0180104320 /NCGR_PEP_ID=MMETSP0985-20121206/31351_1 /TAXON_ID=483367 /ORGANISM="non described non described, Strain CCMP 2436" /LENGTH=83 /DNA_ID=CAMNT_0022041079 /DNA_START=94 /DNA_END=341 /DNA_ORIENTATION=-